MEIFKKFKDLFFKPDIDDHYIIEKWKKESEEENRLKDLHSEARRQINKPKYKNKTSSSNF